MGVHKTDEYGKIKEILDIPIDEPIFILRGQDILAVRTVEGYIDNAREYTKDGITVGWMQNMEFVREEFMDWARSNMDKLKVPD
jgi:hypothetical protein